MRILSALAIAGAMLAAAAPAAAQITKAPAATTKQAIKAETVAKGLVHPWGLAFLPDGRMLVTERPGRMRIVGKDGKLSEPLQGVPAVYANGQGGLLDVVLSPDFATSGLIYFSYSEPRGGGSNGTTVARARLVTQGDGGRLDNFQVIFRQEPAYASSAHFGSRIVFMPDGSLFITMGDRYSARDQAQNPGNHLGKLVRVLPDGRPHPDNPKRDGWRPEIWSIGHRNVQGAALNPASGRVWTIEHARARRRRDQRAAIGQELRLAGHHLRPRLLLRQDRRGHREGRHGAAGLLLGSVDRAIGCRVLHGQPVPRMEGQPVRRRAGRPGVCTAWCSTAKGSSARRCC